MDNWQRNILRYFVCGALLIFSICVLRTDLQHSFRSIKVFLREHGQNKEIFLDYNVYHRANEIKNILPSKSRVQLSFPKLDPNRIVTRFYLYPIEVSDDWQYFVDVGNVNRHIFPSSWSSYELFTGDTVYARPGNSFSQATDQKDPFSLKKAALVFLLIIIFKAAVGYLFLGCINVEHFGGDRTGSITMGYLIGELLLTSVVWGYLILGGEFIIEGVVILWAIVALILLMITHIKKRKRILSNPFKNIHYPPHFLSGMAIVIVLIFLFGISMQPISDWDAMSFWIMKSKVLYHKQVLDLSYTHHNHYPMLWTLCVATQFVILGMDYEQIAQWTSALFFLILIVQIISSLKLFRLRPEIIPVGVLFFLLAFFKGRVMFSSSAENAFLAYTAGLVTSLIAWFAYSKNNNYAYLAILMALGLTVIKFEGFLTSIFVGLSLLCLNDRRIFLDRKISLIMCFMLFVPVIELLWFFWVKMNGYFGGSIHLQTALTHEKILLIADMVLRTLVKSRIFFMMLIALYFLRLQQNKHSWREDERLLLYLSCFLLSFSLFIAYTGLPEDQIIRGGEAVIRLSLHASPAITALWCSRMFRHS